MDITRISKSNIIISNQLEYHLEQNYFNGSSDNLLSVSVNREGINRTVNQEIFHSHMNLITKNTLTKMSSAEERFNKGLWSWNFLVWSLKAKILQMLKDKQFHNLLVYEKNILLNMPDIFQAKAQYRISSSSSRTDC